MVIARGLIKGWKMPIFFGVDTPMTLVLFNKIVKALEEKGFRVWGASFDLGNHEFLKDIKFKDGTYKLPNPATSSRPVFLDPDTPHMLKLFRKHLFEKGFWLPNDFLSKKFGKPSKKNFDMLKSCGDYFRIDVSHFKSILEADSGEFKIHWKLKNGHINMEEGKKMNVRIAAQTLSATSAAALKFIRPECGKQATVILTANNVRIN